MATRQKRKYFERLKTAHHYPKVWDQLGLRKGDPSGRQADRNEIIVNRVAPLHISSWGDLAPFGA